MPIELTELLSNHRWLEIEIEDHAINIAYNPNRITNRRLAELQSLQDELARANGNVGSLESEALNMTIDLFCDVVVDWDIMQDGEPYPITPEALQDFPSYIMNQIWGALHADINADADQKKALKGISGAGLPRTASQDTAPTGIQSSRPPSSFRSRRGS